MSTTKTIFQLGFATLTATALLLSGCAQPAAEEEASLTVENTPPVAMAAHATEEVETQHELVGIWWGTGILDQESLNQAVEGLSAETRRQVTTAAESFLATEMAIEFKPDGKMDTAVEVTGKSGRRESGMGIATWEAAPTINAGEYRVTSVETQSNGLKVTDHKTYRVSKDGSQLTLLVDLPGLLGQCNPRIVLKRQEESQSVAAVQDVLLR